MTLNEKEIDVMLDKLNSIICEENILSRADKENLIRTVSILGMLKAPFRELTGSPRKEKKDKKDKKDREIDPVFPRHGVKWTDEDVEFILGVINDIPDEAIDDQIVWISEKMGKTPYAIAMKIVALGRMDKEWSVKYKSMADEIRKNALSGQAGTDMQHSDSNSGIADLVPSPVSWHEAQSFYNDDEK